MTNATTQTAAGYSLNRADVYLMNAVLNQGGTVGVVSEGEVLLRCSQSLMQAMEVLSSLDEALIVLRDAHGEKIGAAYAVYEYSQDAGSELNTWTAGYVDGVMDEFLATA
jgi:hypothetical protein